MSLSERFTLTEGQVFLTGVQALIRVLLDQGRADRAAGLHTAGLVSGYPGSPLGGVDLEMARQRALLEDAGIRHIPGLNEDLAATAIWGSQTVGVMPNPRVDGVFGMWYGKAPGVDRSGDALRHANIRGTSRYGGALVVAGDDPDARSTNFPTDSTGAFIDWSMPVLFPGTIQDILDLGRHGYELSRLAGLWVGFKMVTELADGSGTVTVDAERLSISRPELLWDGRRFEPELRVNGPGGPMREAERDLVHARLKLAADYISTNGLNPVEIQPASARLGLVAAGKTYSDLRAALGRLGLTVHDLKELGIRVKKVSALFPINREEWREFATGLSEIIVIEEKRPLLERTLKEALYDSANRPRIVGKEDEAGQELFPAFGELTADLVAERLGTRLLDRWEVDRVAGAVQGLGAKKRELIPLSVSRTPFFCSGCPHNRSLVVPEGSIVGAGIGCHILELVVPRPEYGEMAGYTQMGAEGAQWVGAAPFTGTPHIFQNIGDGTFHHSGSLALRFAIANNVNITYKLLYNSAVGMTGGQDVQGALPVPELVRMLDAEGVRRIIITTDEPRRYKKVSLPAGVTVRHRDRLIECQSELAATPGVTVLLHDQQCAAEKRRLRKRDRQQQPTRRIVINERVCEGCGDCGARSQCLSVQPVETEFGRKTRIHQSSCNLDYSCADGNCPSFLVVETKGRKTPEKKRPIPPEVAEPSPLVVGDVYRIEMVGIGGTGVVTVSQILATAATAEGWDVRDLDLTGSSQKAGPVVSELQLFRPSVAQPPASAIGSGEVDLLLAFDLLGAVEGRVVSKCAPGRTQTVASTTPTPTGEMSFNPGAVYPETAGLLQSLRSVSVPGGVRAFDAQQLALELFGNHMLSNMLVVGAAYQVGALPLGAGAITDAIRLNGVAVQANLDAFAWGRAVVVDPTIVPAVDTAPVRTRRSSWRLEQRVTPGLEAIIERRASDLEDYQSAAYARHYLRVVEDFATAEAAASGNAGPLTEAVARNLYKLMAYKDEYEVARLHLLEADAAVAAQVGEGVTFSWLLHPPVLKALGFKKKIAVGPWFRPAFQGLQAMRRVRGTPADPFGYTAMRKIERALVRDYEQLVATVGRSLDRASVPALEQLLDAPDMVRGYEEVKLRNVEEYCGRLRSLTEQFGLTHAAPTKVEELLGVGTNVIRRRSSESD